MAEVAASPAPVPRVEPGIQGQLARPILDADGRPTEPLSTRELVELNCYWLAIQLLWGATIMLVPLLMIDYACGGVSECTRPVAILGAFAPGKGTAEAIISVVGSIVAIAVQPTIAAISDYTTSRFGRRKPFIFVGTLLDMAFITGLYLAGSWVGVFVFMVLLQFSSNFAQGPFQGYMPDLVPEDQVGRASGLMGLMMLVGTGGGAMLVSAAQWLGNPRYVLLFVVAAELVTMLVTMVRVRRGRQGLSREGRSWVRVAAGTWGTDILAERSYLWLLASRLFLLMATGTLSALAFFYMQDSFGLERSSALAYAGVAAALMVVFGALATLPSGTLSERHGRKRLIYAAASVGAVGMVVLVVAPHPLVALAFVVLIGIGSGMFLAVDWALMTDIIPKAESGRYMGISNVVTGSSGAISGAIGLVILDAGNAALGYGAGPRIALAVACTYYLIGSALLTRVREPRRGVAPSPETSFRPSGQAATS